MAEEKKTFRLEIVTPDKQVFLGQAQGLVFPAQDGLLGVEAGHEPIAAAVIPGELRFCAGGEWTALVEQIKGLRSTVTIGLVGKYVQLHDAYLSVAEALRHAG